MQRIRGQKRKKTSRGQIKLQRLEDSQRVTLHCAFTISGRFLSSLSTADLQQCRYLTIVTFFFTQLHEFNSGVVAVFTTRFQINQIKAICIHLPLFFIFICWGLLV